MSIRKMVNPGIEMVENNILVYVELPKTETEGGLVLDENTARAVQKDLCGHIVAIGPNVNNFTEGEKILLPPHGSTPVSWKGEVYHVFRETSLFAKIKADEQ